MKIRILPILLVCALLGAGQTTWAGTNSSAARYLDTNSMFGRYFAQFSEQYGKNYSNRQQAFRAFCMLLQDSDLLSIEIIEAGIPAQQIYPALQTLLTADPNTADAETMRAAVHAVDYVLESIEFRFTRNHRGEFRREVLAQVPPLSFNG